MVLAPTLWGANIGIIRAKMRLLYDIAIENPKMLPIIFKKIKNFFALAKKRASFHRNQETTRTPGDCNYRTKRLLQDFFPK